MFIDDTGDLVLATWGPAWRWQLRDVPRASPASKLPWKTGTPAWPRQLEVRVVVEEEPGDIFDPTISAYGRSADELFPDRRVGRSLDGRSCGARRCTLDPR